MPILARESDLYPEDLLEWENLGNEHDRGWLALYTRSRREKDLMRRLVPLEVPFYAPMHEKREPSPKGRVRSTFLPMFSNYVFIYATPEQRYSAMTTNCISRCIEVRDGAKLTHDLRQVRQVILTGLPITVEERLGPGDYVRVKSGALRNCEGTVIERRGSRRLLVEVQLIQRVISVQLDDVQLEPTTPRDFSVEQRPE